MNSSIIKVKNIILQIVLNLLIILQKQDYKSTKITCLLPLKSMNPRIPFFDKAAMHETLYGFYHYFAIRKV